MTIVLGTKSIIWIITVVSYFLILFRFDSRESGGLFSVSERSYMGVILAPVFLVLGLVAHLIYLEWFQ